MMDELVPRNEGMEVLDVLDAALERVLAGESVAGVLAQYPEQAQELEGLLMAVQSVGSLSPVKMPAAGQQQSDRHAFLEQVRQLQSSSQSDDSLLRQLVARLRLPGVFRPAGTRHTRKRKERREMVPVLARLMLMFGLAFGSVGGTAALAAGSLPGSALYPVKLAAEETRLEMAADPAVKAELAMAQVQERTQEMVQLAQQGEAPETAVMTRLQEQLQQSLRLGAELPEEEFGQWMTRTQQMTQTQAQALDAAGAAAGPEAQAQLQAANRLMNQVRQQVETGLEDPTALRQQLRSGQAWAVEDDDPDGSTDVESGDRLRTRDASCLDGDPECIPAGDANRYGQESEDSAAGPGQPGGNPDGPCEVGDPDCVPTGDANRYGPQAQGAGPGEPGGNPDGLCQEGDADCVPEGDANRYGQESEEPAAGPGEPGGNPEAPCQLGDPNCVCNADGTECEPVGDSNPAQDSGAGQYGSQAEGAGPGEQGGNPEGDGTPAGDENKNQGSQSTPSSDDGGSGSSSGSSDGGSGQK